MVNVASQLPFNLHNQVIQKTEYHSRSRSVSESRDRYYDRRDRSCYPALYSNHDMDHFRNQSKYTHGLGRLRPASPHLGFLEGGLSTRTRSPSPIAAEQPTPARLLNIRLIGYTDANVRGRARERGSYPTGLPETKNSSSDRVQGISPVIDQPTVCAFIFQGFDFGQLILLLARWLLICTFPTRVLWLWPGGTSIPFFSFCEKSLQSVVISFAHLL